MDKLTLILTMLLMYLSGIVTVFATMGVLKDRQDARMTEMFKDLSGQYSVKKKPITLKKLKREQEAVVKVKVKK
jgi:hypothetical protein